MLTKTDLVLILTDIESNGVNVTNQIAKLMKSDSISLDVLKFINSQRQLDVADFYNMIRKNYNNKKSVIITNKIEEKYSNVKFITRQQFLR